VTVSPSLKALCPDSKRPKCRTWPEETASMRTALTLKVLLEVFMMPTSEGWPPPCGWKIVCSVMTTWSSSLACLNRDWLASSNDVAERIDRTAVAREYNFALCWNAR